MADLAEAIEEHESQPHCHKCESCGVIWEHVINAFTCTYDNHHRCPKCGTTQTLKHYGEKPTYPHPAPLWPGIVKAEAKSVSVGYR